MQNFEVNLLLKENKWISGAEISSLDADKNACQIYMDISPDGHELVRDHGMQVLEQQIQTRLLSLGLNENCWEIRPVGEDVWGGTIPTGKHKFPQVLSRINDFPEEKILLDVSSDLGWFQGHFPDNPILAGVVQLHWAVCASRTLFELVEMPVEMKRLKFKSIVSPPRILELVLNRLSEHEVQFEFHSLGQVHSLGRLIF